MLIREMQTNRGTTILSLLAAPFPVVWNSALPSTPALLQQRLLN
ncbi:MAG: hypothetical protein ACI3XN_06955 [Eubacteriales bacterium]